MPYFNNFTAIIVIYLKPFLQERYCSKFSKQSNEVFVAWYMIMMLQGKIVNKQVTTLEPNNNPRLWGTLLDSIAPDPFGWLQRLLSDLCTLRLK